MGLWEPDSLRHNPPQGEDSRKTPLTTSEPGPFLHIQHCGLGPLNWVSFFSKSLAPSAVSVCHQELRLETIQRVTASPEEGMGKARAGARKALCVARPPHPAEKLPSPSEDSAGQESTDDKIVCLTLGLTTVWFQLSTKISLVTRLPYLPQLI